MYAFKQGVLVVQSVICIYWFKVASAKEEIVKEDFASCSVDGSSLDCLTTSWSIAGTGAAPELRESNPNFQVPVLVLKNKKTVTLEFDTLGFVDIEVRLNATGSGLEGFEGENCDAQVTIADSELGFEVGDIVSATAGQSAQSVKTFMLVEPNLNNRDSLSLIMRVEGDANNDQCLFDDVLILGNPLAPSNSPSTPTETPPSSSPAISPVPIQPAPSISTNTLQPTDESGPDSLIPAIGISSGVVFLGLAFILLYVNNKRKKQEEERIILEMLSGKPSKRKAEKHAKVSKDSNKNGDTNVENYETEAIQTVKTRGPTNEYLNKITEERPRSIFRPSSAYLSRFKVGQRHKPEL